MHPPALEDIVDLENNPLGSSFQLNQELWAQFDGAWKRLWECIVMHSASEKSRCSSAYMQDCRMEVEEQFERDITGEEWARLIVHAKLRAQRR